MGNLAITYQHIADILSFETLNAKLEKTISHPSFNWDAIVIEGSRHLILPAIYCRLKSRQLLHTLPEELSNYLEELTSINRCRNKSILKQVDKISELFKKHNIEHVFLKGAALLKLDYYEDIAERMLGDIDILVADEHINTAYKLLIKDGYVESEQTLGHKFFGHKHLPRLTPKNEICAVELHRRLFVSYNSKELSSENVLNNKKQKNQVYIPSISHLLMHNILNCQINDKGSLYNSISFRPTYDTIIIQKTFDSKPNWYNSKYYKSYFRYSSLFFKDISKKTDLAPNLMTSFYLFKLRNVVFYRFWNRILKISDFLPILHKRLWFFIISKAYRSAVINDKSLIYRHLKSIINGS